MTNIIRFMLITTLLTVFSVTADAAGIKYGGTTELNGGICHRAGANHRIDRHTIPFIQPSDTTTRIVKELSLNLTKTYNENRNAKMAAHMLGAGSISINGAELLVVAISGQDHILGDAERKAMMKELTTSDGMLKWRRNVKLITDNGSSINFPDNPWYLEKDGNWITHRHIDMQIRGEPGTLNALCAARKIMRHFNDRLQGLAQAGKIPPVTRVKIHMTETYWHPPGTERGSRYSSGEPVPSCEACQQILHQMLCDIKD